MNKCGISYYLPHKRLTPVFKSVIIQPNLRESVSSQMILTVRPKNGVI